MFGLCCLFLDACFVLFGVWFIVCSYDLLLVAFNCCCRLCACWVFGVLILCLVCCIACCLCCFEVGLWVGDCLVISLGVSWLVIALYWIG